MITIEKHTTRGTEFEITTVKMTAKDLLDLTFSATEVEFIADNKVLRASSPTEELVKLIKELNND